MLGRATVWCLMFWHVEAMWHSREDGNGWICPTCLRVGYSRALPQPEVQP